MIIFMFLSNPKRASRLVLARFVVGVSGMALRLSHTLSGWSNRILQVPPVKYQAAEELPAFGNTWFMVKENGPILTFDGLIAPDRTTALASSMGIPGQLKMLENLEYIRRSIVANVASRSVGPHVH